MTVGAFLDDSALDDTRENIIILINNIPTIAAATTKIAAFIKKYGHICIYV